MCRVKIREYKSALQYLFHFYYKRSRIDVSCEEQNWRDSKVEHKVLDKMKNKDTSSKTRKESCIFFFSTKGCRRGDECPFLHQTSEGNMSQGDTLNQSTHPIGRVDKDVLKRKNEDTNPPACAKVKMPPSKKAKMKSNKLYSQSIENEDSPLILVKDTKTLVPRTIAITNINKIAKQAHTAGFDAFATGRISRHSK